MISVEIQEINASLTQKQFHDAIKLTEYFTKYLKFIMKREQKKKFLALSPLKRTPQNLWKFALDCVQKIIKSRKNRSINYFVLPPEQYEFNKNTFKTLSKLLKKGKELKKEELFLYNRIIFLSKITDLYDWNSQVLAEITEETRNSNNSGWLKFLKFSKKGEYEEIIAQVTEDSLSLPSSYVWLEFSFVLSSGYFVLCKNQLDGVERIKLVYEGLSVNVNLRIMGSDISLAVQNLSVLYEESTSQLMIVQKAECNKSDLLYVNYSAKPLNSEATARLDLESQSIEVNFDSKAINSLISFFLVLNAQEIVKTAAWDTIQEIQDTTQETLTDLFYKQNQFEISIKASGPIIKLPSQHGFFYLSLGQFSVQNTDSNNENYEGFEINLASLELKYEKDEDSIVIVPSFEISCRLLYLKAKIKEKKWKSTGNSMDLMPDIVVDGEVKRIRVKLSPSVYHQLLTVTDNISIELDFTNTIHLDKREIIKNSKLITKVRKQGTGLLNWTQYIGILSGAYIYFFINEKETISAIQYYIKDCSITQVPSLPNTLHLQNRFGECILSFFKEKEYSKWLDSLSDQVLKFQSHKSAAKITSQVPYEKSVIHLMLKIPAISVKLCNEDGVALSELSIGELQTSIKARSYDLKLTGSLNSLTVKDLQRYSSSVHFNSFARSVNEKSGLIDLELEYCESNSPLYSGKDLEVQVKLGKAEVNWNPDIISSVISFFAFAEYSDPNFKKGRDVGMLHPNHVLVHIHVTIESIEVYFNNVQKEISLAVISMLNADTDFIIMNGGYKWSGTIGNLTLSDLTNYPKTALMEEIQPFTLFSVKEKTESLLRFSILIYKVDNPEAPKDIGSTVEMELNSVSIVYLHQPFMRILDYVSYKILGVFDAQARVKDVNYWSPIYKLSYLLNMPTIQSLKNDEDLMQDTKSFSSIKICMKNPMITLIPRPGYSEFFEFDLGTIRVSNCPDYEMQNDSEIWLDVYTIHMENIQIRSVNENISEDFNVSLKVTRPVLSNSQLIDANIDKRYKIDAKCETIKLMFSHVDYRLMLKVMDLNLTYDDQLENYINPEAIVYAFADNDPTHGGVFFKLFMDIDVLSILLTHENQPITELLSVKSTFEMLKFNDYASDISFKCLHFCGLMSENMIKPKPPPLYHKSYSMTSAEELKAKASEEIDISEDIFDIPTNSVLQSYKQHIKLTKVLFGPLPEVEKTEEDQVSLKMDFKGDFDGSKSIILSFAQIRINFHLTVIQLVQNFFYYGFPDYTIEEETPYDFMNKYKPPFKLVQKEIIPEYLAPKLLVNLCITNPIMLLPTYGSTRVVVAQTDVNFVYLREKETGVFSETERAGEMKYVLHQLELYTCKLEELISKSSFLTVQKRRILEPVQVFYESLYTRPEKFRFVYDVRYEVERLAFTVSHRDILLLNSVATVQGKVLTNGSRLIESLAVYPKESSSQSIVWYMTCKTVYSSSGVNVLVINDALGAYSPILDFNCQPAKIRVTDSKNLWTLACSLSMRINYYNPQIDIWEPFIELFTVNVDANNSPLANPQKQNIIILDEKMPLNVNLTEAMINHLQIVLDSWQKSTLSQGNELVSPITICNKTGYPIKATRITHKQEAKDTLEIPIQKTLNFEIDSTEIRTLDFKKETLKISIENFPDIDKIYMNKLTSFSKEVMENICVIVEINLLDTTKLLTIRSEFTVVNLTDYSFALRFSNSIKGEENMCKPGMEVPVPIEFCRSKASFKPLQYIDKSWIDFDLEKYSAKMSGECTEVRINDFYFLLVMVRDLQNPKKITLNIKAPIIISNYLPCEMTLQIFYDSQAIRELNLLPNESYKEHTTSVNSGLQCSLKLPNFQFSARTNILHRNSRPPKHITMRDSNDDFLHVYIDYKLDSSHMFNFYTPIVFINNTSVPISFFYKKTSTKRAAGQSLDNPITPAHSTKKVRISIGKNKSKGFKIGAVGVKNVVQFLGDIDSEGFQVRYQFLYEILLARVIEGELLFTKVLIISPRYLLINSLDEDLVIKQYNSVAPETLLARRSKEPFHWPDSNSDDLLILKLGCGDWNWSGAFSIANIGTFTVQCQFSPPSYMYKLIKVEIKLQDSTALVLFSEEHEMYSSYRIDNKSSLYSLLVFQDGCREESRQINIKSTSSFAWSQPLLDHELIVDFYTGSFLESAVKADCKFKFPLDEMNVIYKIPVNEDSQDIVYGRTMHQGSTKVLCFTDEPISREKKRETILSQTHVTLHKFGISIIEQVEESNCEILYCSASSITILNQSTKLQNKVEVLIRSFQIDNQYNFSAIYPVILYPADPTQEALSIVALSFVDENPNCIHFEKVSVTVQPLTLSLESWIVRKTLEMVSRVAKQNSPVYDAMKVYRLHKSPTWTRSEDIIATKSYYIASMEIQPIKLILSFVPLKEENVGSDSFTKVARALGMAITAIDSVPVKLYSAEMMDVFGSSGQIFSVIWMHYRAQLASEIFTLIGHAELLGNPIGLLNNLGTGVVDFFYEPAHGMIKGPIGAGKGLIKGTGSLLKNTVQGTFGTVSKLANSLATGITLTQDREYLSSRQREKMNKPKNVVDGVGMGFKVFFTNLGKGIAGVVMEPIKGYKKKKIKGLLIGSARGLTGLFIKPMAGILDAASKAAEGVKNTADVFKKVIVFQRSRVPRPFYGEKSLVKPYNEYDSQVLFFVNQLKKGLFIKERFVGQAVSKDIRGEKLVCVLYLKKIVLADIRTKKLLWTVDVNSINSCVIIDKGIVFSTSPSTYKLTKNKQSFLIPFPSADVKTELFLKIREILNPVGVNILNN